ncbi:hypothetical protein [Streptomyces hesseae]|uniref:NYN domain-containing protein n=1 Tax=Streptomyces hesseae TaxID=3075519 RepID=A0ABU2SQX4_9ACTN|nr:hypothetical protein [Streptomyces sp. DSM 40473]MDT0451408.1 hypothetical protein [Streptomyces sp. DSM 40473]
MNTDKPVGAWQDARPDDARPLSLTAEENGLVTARWERARAAHPQLDTVVETLATRLAEPYGARLEGKQYRLKSLIAFRRRAATRKRLRVDVEVFVRKVTDLNRYTLVLATDHYTAGVQQTYALLHEQGFELVPGSERNTWEDPLYKGFRAAWQRPGGEPRFEIRFHTAESYSAQSENQLLYDLYRSGRMRGVRAVSGPEFSKAHEQAAVLVQSGRYGMESGKEGH